MHPFEIASVPNAAGNYSIVATVSASGFRTTEANAKIIAAAPEMLGALQWMLALIDGGEQMPKPGDDVVEEIRAAISKAEGR